MKKKIFCLFLSVVILACTFTFGEGIFVSAATSGTCGDNATWVYDSTTTTLTISGTGAVYGYKNVTGSQAPWVSYKSDVTTLIVSEGITELGYYDFYNMTALNSVSLPSTLITISAYYNYGCFKGCTSLESITLPNNLETIGAYSFQDCSALTSIVIPDSVTTLGNYAFYNCTSLTTVTYGTGLTTTGDSAFRGAPVKTIRFSSTINTISAYSFYGNYLTKIEIPETISSIESRAFANSTFLGQVIIYNRNLTFGTLDPFGSSAKDVVIYGYTGSTAETFANEKSYEFVSLDDCSHESQTTEIVVEPTCLETGTAQDVCDLCGVSVQTYSLDALGHDYIDIEILDNTYVDGHIYQNQQCSRCNNDQDVVTHQQDTSEDAITTYIWIDGTYTYSNTATCTRAGIETYTCEICSQTERHVSSSGNHNVTEYVVTTEATCESDGSKEGVCSICEETITITISATGHQYTDENLVEEIDDLEYTGHIYYVYLCQNCNEMIIEYDHQEWIEDCYTSVVISEAHCVISGLKRDTCNICETTRNVILEANGQHEWYETTTTDPTCTTVGKIYYACENCTLTKYENIEALGHDYETVENSGTQATCTSSGYYIQTCSRCSASKQITVAATGHTIDEDNYVETITASCTSDGSYTSVCLICGEEFSNTIETLGHDYENIARDLTDDGKPGHSYVTPTCTRCGNIGTQTISHDEWLEEYYTRSILINPASSTTLGVCTSGIARDTCSLCGETRTVTLDAPHRYGCIAINTENNELTYSCSVCSGETIISMSDLCWDNSNLGLETESGDSKNYMDLNNDGVINAKDLLLYKKYFS